MRICILMLTLLFSTYALSAEVQYEVGGGIQYFSGLDAKSLAPDTGVLLRFGAGTGIKTILRWYTSLNLINGAGKALFNDAGTETELDYKLMAGEFNFGVKFTPLATISKLPIQPYLGASGSAQSTSIIFSDTAVLSATFPRTASGNFYGSNIFMGVDIDIGKNWGIQFHIEQSTIAGTIASKQFMISGNRFFFGLFFK